MTMNLPRTVVLLGVVSFLGDVSSEMIFPLLPLFITVTLRADAAFLGVVEGAADTLSALLKGVSGVLADRARRFRPLIMAGYGVSGVSRALMSMALFPWHVLMLRLVDRVGKGLRTSPRDALIAVTAQDGATGQAFGFHRAMDHGGAVVGPVVATALLSLGLSVREVFFAAVIPTVVMLGVLTRIQEAPREVPAAPLPLGQLWSGQALGPELRRYLLILFVFALGNASDAFLLLRAYELGLAQEGVPLLWAVINGVRMLGSLYGGRLADRLPREGLIAAGWLIYALTWAGLAHAELAWQVWALCALYGLYAGLTEPAQRAFIKDLAPAEALGRAYGWFNLVVGLCALPASLLMGWLWRVLGSQRAMDLGAVWALLSVVLLLLWWRSRLRPAPSPPSS